MSFACILSFTSHTETSPQIEWGLTFSLWRKKWKILETLIRMSWTSEPVVVVSQFLNSRFFKAQDTSTNSGQSKVIFVSNWHLKGQILNTNWGQLLEQMQNNNGANLKKHFKVNGRKLVPSACCRSMIEREWQLDFFLILWMLIAEDLPKFLDWSKVLLEGMSLSCGQRAYSGGQLFFFFEKNLLSRNTCLSKSPNEFTTRYSIWLVGANAA